MRWFIGFSLSFRQPVYANQLASSPVLEKIIAAAFQVDPYRVRVVISAEGDSQTAVFKATETLWSLLESEALVATIDQALLNPDIDCLSVVKNLEILRHNSLNLFAKCLPAPKEATSSWCFICGEGLIDVISPLRCTDCDTWLCSSDCIDKHRLNIGP